MAQPPADREAIGLLRRRDPRGFDLAYAAYAARVRGFLLRLCRDRTLTDDLLQHTFMRLAEQGPVGSPQPPSACSRTVRAGTHW